MFFIPALWQGYAIPPSTFFIILWDGCEIKLKKGEPVERAIRRLKKKLEREQTLKKFRERKRFEKPSAKRRRKQKAARFAAMLKTRHAED